MIPTENIKELRDKTGISVMQCQKALQEAGGDMEKALFFLRKQSSVIAAKKSDRTLGAGLIQAYIHANCSIGAMVELNCETDFVAKNPEFKTLAYDIAMHTAAASPEYLAYKDIPESVKVEVGKMVDEEIARDAGEKPDEIKIKMREGKLAAYFKEKTLLDQAFIKDPSMTIDALIKGFVQKFGEKIEVGKFARLSVLGK